METNEELNKLNLFIESFEKMLFHMKRVKVLPQTQKDESILEMKQILKKARSYRRSLLSLDNSVKKAS